MRSKKGKSLLKLSWVVGTGAVGAVLLVMISSQLIGCTPKIANDWKYDSSPSLYLDLQSNPKVVPQPLYVGMFPTFNPPTGTVDQSGIDGYNPETGEDYLLPKGVTWRAGMDCRKPNPIDNSCIPLPLVDCYSLDKEQQKVMSTPTCIVFQYLQSLSGFPTASPVAIPATAAISNDSITDDNLVVFSYDRDQDPADTSTIKTMFKKTDMVDTPFITKEADGKIVNMLALNFGQSPVWKANNNVVIAVRGYDNGIKTASGIPFLSSQIYFLLKSKDSLTCGATTGDEDPNACQLFPKVTLDDSCNYYTMLKSMPGMEGVSQVDLSGQLCGLEALRKQFFSTTLARVDAATGSPDMSKESAIAFEFPTHKEAVIEYLPTVGIFGSEPVSFPTTDNTKMFIKVDGKVAPKQLIPITGDPTKLGTVFLARQDPPATITPLFFELKWDDNKNQEGGVIEITLSQTDNAVGYRSFDPINNTYIVYISKGIDETKNTEPILTNMVPFMATELAKINISQKNTLPMENILYDLSNDKFIPITPLSGLLDVSDDTRKLAKIAECKRLSFQMLLWAIQANFRELSINNTLFVEQIGNYNYDILGALPINRSTDLAQCKDFDGKY